MQVLSEEASADQDQVKGTARISCRKHMKLGKRRDKCKFLGSASLVSMQRRNKNLHVELQGFPSVLPAKIPSFTSAALAHYGRSLAKLGIARKKAEITKAHQTGITGEEACLY